MGVAERKERDFRRREQDILDAAVRLFDDDDWQLVTIETIAQKAEIGKGTVYLHFPTKEEIYARLALDFSRQLLTKLQQMDPGLPVLERLRQAIRLYFDAHRAGKRYVRVVEYCNRDDFRRRVSERTQQEFQEIDAQFDALFVGVLEQGIEQGVLPRLPIPELIYGAHSTLAGAVRLLQSDCLHVADADEYVAVITRFIIAGLRHMDEASPTSNTSAIPA